MNFPSGDVSWMDTFPLADRWKDCRDAVSPFTTRIVSEASRERERENQCRSPA